MSLKPEKAVQITDLGSEHHVLNHRLGSVDRDHPGWWARRLSGNPQGFDLDFLRTRRLEVVAQVMRLTEDEGWSLLFSEPYISNWNDQHRTHLDNLHLMKALQDSSPTVVLNMAPHSREIGEATLIKQTENKPGAEAIDQAFVKAVQTVWINGGVERVIANPQGTFDTAIREAFGDPSLGWSPVGNAERFIHRLGLSIGKTAQWQNRELN